jgi:hypothetical protein
MRDVKIKLKRIGIVARTSNANKSSKLANSDSVALRAACGGTSDAVLNTTCARGTNGAADAMMP